MPGMENITKKAHLYAGIDAGSVSVNCAVIDGSRRLVREYPYVRHMGRVEHAVRTLIRDLHKNFGEDLLRSISFTGTHGKMLSEELGTFYEFETISQVIGAVFLIPHVRTIISMGGQHTALFQIAHHKSSDNHWELEYFNTNGPCASGTGSFIDQQAQRLSASIYGGGDDTAGGSIDRILRDFIRLGLKSDVPANVACRCTVFTKTDMIHLQNKGEKLEDIIYGLHVGNARNYMSAIVSNHTLQEPIIFIGGLSLNSLQVKAFKNYFPELVVPKHSSSFGALGSALQALESGTGGGVDPKKLEALGLQHSFNVPSAPRLELKKSVFHQSNHLPNTEILDNTRMFLGIDIGSTTTKYALIDDSCSIVHKNYVPTRGRPIEVTRGLLKGIMDNLGKDIEISGVATTGSGRSVVGDFLNADLIIDEITAHARGAVEIDPQVDTVFEIGGQDSKYILIKNGNPTDFDMNKVCAAGTGSFLHELANKYEINIVDEFQNTALSSESPVKLTDRCTVFMESDLESYHQKGIATKDLIAGLCYAIVYNYMNRVVGKRKIGNRLMFLGGPSLNKGVVAAFENVLGREIIVPMHREVLGAYGAALAVRETTIQEKRTESGFRGLESAAADTMHCREQVCRADPHCHNKCKLKIYSFDGRRSIWGGECGRYELVRGRSKRTDDCFDLRRRIWESYMEGVSARCGDEPRMKIDGRPTVGIQRMLYGLHFGVLWAHFFDQLGYRLVLSPQTDNEISRTGAEMMQGEACYPVKVSHGHVDRIARNTKYLFLPSIIDIPVSAEQEMGFYCPMVQGNSYMTRMALGLDQRYVLHPVVHLKHDPDRLSLELTEQVGRKLGASGADIRHALKYAVRKNGEFVEEMRREGASIIQARNPEKPFVVVTGRPYNLYDEKLNLRIGRNLAGVGVTAVPMDFIDTDAVDLSDFPSMYWGLGAQILRAARLVKEREGFFGIHLTNFSCGADSFLEHFYRQIMGEKAYLILELDEHTAEAGVMTRIEAFKNVMENTMRKTDACFMRFSRTGKDGRINISIAD